MFHTPTSSPTSCRRQGMICNDRGSLSILAGGTISPPAGPGQSPRGGPGGEAPGSSRDPAISEV